MKGAYYFDKKAKRYYVSVYWDGAMRRIYRYNGDPIWHERVADKLLSHIRAEIDDGVFNIKAYLPDSPVGLRAYSETWLSASTACANTKRVHRSALKRAIEAWGPEYDIRKITHGKLAILQNSLSGSVKWKNATMIALKAMLRFAYKDEAIPKVPVFPPLQPTQQSDIEYLSYDEQQRVVAAIPERDRAIFRFGMEFGLRIGEVRALKKDSIVDGQLIVARSFSQWELRETTKTYRIRRLPLTTVAKEILKAAPASFSDYLFTYDGQRPYYERKMREIWKAACNESGVKINQKNALRHSLGCQLLDEGVDLEMVRDIYGHSTTDMTRRYAKRTPKRMLDALESRGKVLPLKTGEKLL